MDVLLVEDDHVFATCLKALIGPFCQLHTVHHFDQGKIALEQRNWDLVILDIQIDSHEDGIDLLQLSTHQNNATIMLTASKDDSLHKKSLAFGAREYFSKLEVGKVVVNYVKNFDGVRNIAASIIDNLFSPFNFNRPMIFFTHNTDAKLIKLAAKEACKQNEILEYQGQELDMNPKGLQALFIENLNEWQQSFKDLSQWKNYILIACIPQKIEEIEEEYHEKYQAWNYYYPSLMI